MTQRSEPTVNEYRGGIKVRHDPDASKTDVVAIATQMLLNDIQDARITGADIDGIGAVYDHGAESEVSIEFVLGASQAPDDRVLEQGDVSFLEKIGEVTKSDL